MKNGLEIRSIFRLNLGLTIGLPEPIRTDLNRVGKTLFGAQTAYSYDSGGCGINYKQ